MVVTGAGWSGTGSSAVIHLLNEFENTYDGQIEEYEHHLCEVSHGLFEFGDSLCNIHTLYHADAAIQDFLQAMSHLNESYLGFRYGNRFMTIVHDFINDVTEYTGEGYWLNDYKFTWSIKRVCIDTIKKIIGRRINQYGKKKTIAGDGIVRFSFIEREDFYKKATAFMNNYFSMIRGEESDKILLLNQLLHAPTVHRIQHYFGDDMRVIVVRRDPRDMFIIRKYLRSRFGGPSNFPTDANEFVKFYKAYLDATPIIEDRRVLWLQFEDLIYDYNNTVEKIKAFLGSDALGRHICPRTHFDPEISIKNTQQWRIKPAWEKEIEPIENNMKEYLYEFPFIVVPRIEETSDPL